MATGTVILQRWLCVASFWRKLMHSHSPHVLLIALIGLKKKNDGGIYFGHIQVSGMTSVKTWRVLFVGRLMDLFAGLSPGTGWARQISFLPGQSRSSDCWCRQSEWRSPDLRRPWQPWQWGHKSCEHDVQGEVIEPGHWLSLTNRFSQGNPLCVQGVRLWEPPPNSQGLAALLLLNILENFPLQGTAWV